MENLKFEIINDGNTLRVTAENLSDFREWVGDEDNFPDSDDAFVNATKSYWANGWGVINADSLGQLSQCLVISRELYYEDDGSLTLHGKAWTNFHDYQIVSPLREIAEHGYYDFLLWDEFDNVNFGTEDWRKSLIIKE